MKTPEEIKRGLDCCCKAGFQMMPCKICPYYDEDVSECANMMCADALAYIKQLEERCERLLHTAEMLNDVLKEYQRRDENEG